MKFFEFDVPIIKFDDLFWTPNLDITPTPERIAGVTIVLQIEEYLGQNESEQGAVNLATSMNIFIN